MKKLFIILAVMAVMFTLLAVSVSAEEITVNMDFIESITTDAEEGTTWGSPEKIFDGNISSAGGWYPDSNNGWAIPAGKTGTVIFVEEFEILSVTLYAWSNWSGTTIIFYDEAGNETGKYSKGDFQSTGGEPIDLGIEGIRAKKMIFKTDSSKGLRNHTYTEFVIKANHEHSYKNEIERLENPTCALPGSAIFECACGLTQESVIPATGEHTEPIEQIVFRDGLTGNGYKAMVCGTCDTQDVRVEGSPEIGPLFESLGYSICTFGDYGIQLGIGVNYENIALYEEVSGKTVEFGTVVTSRNILTEGNPLITDGATGEMMPVDERILVTNLTERNYSVIVSKLSGFGESFLDTELILSVYVRLGNSLFYLGDETTKSVVTKTYNSLAETLN